MSTPYASLSEEQRDKFIEGVSRHFPLTGKMVEQCSDTCGFEALSQNEVLYWSEDLIARFENRWAWDGIYLNTNEALPWSKELIARFESRWNWSRLPSEALTRLTPDHIRQIMSNEQPEKQS